MASIAWSAVVALFPALVDVEEDAQTEILAYANPELDVANFGGESSQRLRMARIFFAGGCGELSLPGAQSGEVASESISADNTMTVSYATAVDSAAFAQTVGGSQFLALVKTTPARLGFVAGLD